MFFSLLPIRADNENLFAKDNLAAWCIVPFDAGKRGPEERAQMLNELGIKRLAYDWRDEHIPTFDQEIDALQKHEIELTSFWMSIDLNPLENKNVKTILEVLTRRQVPTQLWVMLTDNELNKMTHDKKVKACANAFRVLAKEAEKFNGKVGLYNHGGWFGEPQNQVAIVKQINMPNVGIVYNFHHGHEHIDEFAEIFQLMKPHLLAVNLNGMRKGGPKILPVGDGNHELEMMRIIQESGYDGLIGILDHRNELDAKESLQENLDGLKRVLTKMNDETALKTY